MMTSLVFMIGDEFEKALWPKRDVFSAINTFIQLLKQTLYSYGNASAHSSAMGNGMDLIL